ncbi:hypothetical protein Tco_1458855 [Tanacetum coccineum]
MDTEPTTGLKTKDSKSGSSKGAKSQSKSFGKSVQSEEPDFKVVDFVRIKRLLRVNTAKFSKRDLSRSSSMDSDSNSNEDLRLIVNPNEDSKNVKLRLKKWAQMVACSVREASKQPEIKVVE